MKILLIGKNGQIGYELERSLQGLGELIALGRAQMDLNDLYQVREIIRTVKPALIVNAAAYTAVDKAEQEPDLAMRINGEAPGIMAEEAKKLGASMIHYSTDYVFDGGKLEAYSEDDVPNPINIYGKTKLAGEQALQATAIPHLIFRTSWIYGKRGKNFLIAMLRQAEEQRELRVVDDQHGAPTWCRTVADATSQVIMQALSQSKEKDWWSQVSGIYHLTAEQQTTWYGFAQTIFENSESTEKPTVIPVSSTIFNSLAKRPINSLMSCAKFKREFKCVLPNWNLALKLCQN